MDRSKYTPIALAYLCKAIHKTFTGHTHINILRNLEQTVAVWKDRVSSKKSGIEYVQNVFVALCPRWWKGEGGVYRRRETFQWRIQWGGGGGVGAPLLIEILKNIL
jgi:hypothetical protein